MDEFTAKTNEIRRLHKVCRAKNDAVRQAYRTKSNARERRIICICKNAAFALRINMRACAYEMSICTPPEC